MSVNVLETMKQALTFVESGPHSVQLAADLRAAVAELEQAQPVMRAFIGAWGARVEWYSLPEGMHDLYAAPPAPAIPAGWKLVPVEPNINMKHAADLIDLGDGEVGRIILSWEEYGKLYAAMLAAAPQPPEAT